MLVKVKNGKTGFIHCEHKTHLSNSFDVSKKEFSKIWMEKVVKNPKKSKKPVNDIAT